MKNLIKTKKKTKNTISSMHTPNWKKVLYLTIGTILIAISVRYFVIYAGLFSPGIAGFSQGLTYTLFLTTQSGGSGNYVQFSNTVYWIIYLALNIPIIYFTYKKFGKKFLMGSIYVLIIGFAVTMLFTYTPGFDSASMTPSYYPGIVISPSTPQQQAMLYSTLAISGTVGGILYGIGVGMIWKVGFCSMGFDPVGIYLSKEKQIDVSKVLLITSILNAFVWIILNGSISGDINSWTTFLDVIISPRILGTVLFIVVYALIVSMFYPVTRKLLIEVNTLRPKNIAFILRYKEFNRGYTKLSASGTRTQRYIMKIFISYEEKTDLMKYIELADPDAFVTIYRAENIYGNFNSTPETEIDRYLKRKELLKKSTKTTTTTKKAPAKKPVAKKTTTTKKAPAKKPTSKKGNSTPKISSKQNKKR